MAHTITQTCEQAPEAALPSGYTLIEAGPVMPGDECGYAHRILIAQSSHDYATWDAAYPDDRIAGTPGREAFCFSGHYWKRNQYGLMSAAGDFAERIARGY